MPPQHRFHVQFETPFSSYPIDWVSHDQDRAAGIGQQLKMSLITRSEAKRGALMSPVGVELVTQYLSVLGAVGDRSLSGLARFEGQCGPVPLERCLAAPLDIVAKLARQPQGRLLPGGLLPPLRLESHRLVDHPCRQYQQCARYGHRGQHLDHRETKENV